MRVKVHYMLSYIYRLVGELKVEFSYALKASTLEHTCSTQISLANLSLPPALSILLTALVLAV